MTATTSTRERSLTPPEKDERTQVLLALLDERDTIRLRVRASRDELRQWRVEARNLEAQIDDVRSEIRTGIVTESAQPELPYPQAPKPVEPPAYECCECLGTMQQCELNGSLQWVCPKCDHPDIVKQAGLQPEEPPPFCDHKFVDSKNCLKCGISFAELKAESLRESQRLNGIDGASEQPDPETDPPAPDPYWTFRQNYPAASTNEELRLALANCLAPHELNLIDWDVVKSWHPKSGVFDAVAHWARVQNAHQVHKNREPTKGITIPARFPMPGELQKALASSQPKKPTKAGKKTRARKATP